RAHAAHRRAYALRRVGTRGKASGAQRRIMGPEKASRSSARQKKADAEQRDELATLQLTELHLVPTSQGQIARYRIREDQSGGNGTILQPVSRWRGRPMSEVGQERQWPSEQGDGGCPLYYSNCGHDGAPRRDAISIKPLMRLFRLTTASAYVGLKPQCSRHRS